MISRSLFSSEVMIILYSFKKFLEIIIASFAIKNCITAVCVVYFFNIWILF